MVSVHARYRCGAGDFSMLPKKKKAHARDGREGPTPATRICGLGAAAPGALQFPISKHAAARAVLLVWAFPPAAQGLSPATGTELNAHFAAAH